jgi:hypothetical protein
MKYTDQKNAEFNLDKAKILIVDRIKKCELEKSSKNTENIFNHKFLKKSHISEDGNIYQVTFL